MLLKILDCAKGQVRIICYYDDDVTPGLEYVYKKGNLIKECRYSSEGNIQTIYRYNKGCIYETITFHQNGNVKSLEIKEPSMPKPAVFEWDSNGHQVFCAPVGTGITDKDALKIVKEGVRRI